MHKYNSLLSASNRLTEGVGRLSVVMNVESKKIKTYFEYEELFDMARDSLIQKFEFTIELFWKYLKIYLVEIKNVKLVSSSPSDVIRDGCRSGLFNEKDAEAFVKMLKCRNQTSHIYKEEVADQIAKDIVGFHEVIVRNVAKLKPMES